MRVVWSSSAYAQLIAIQDYIAVDDPNAAFEIAERIFAAVDSQLGAHPFAGREGRVAGTRELVISGTPYIVGYRVTEQVEVLAVMHGAKLWPQDL